MRNNSCYIDNTDNDHDELEQFLRQFDKKEEMSESDWIRHFMPFDNPNSKNMLFDRDDPRDAAFLAKMGERHIWTEVDWDCWDGCACKSEDFETCEDCRDCDGCEESGTCKLCDCGGKGSNKDSPQPSFAILPGIRFVNRIGYIVTLVPWDASHRDMVVLDYACEREA